MPIGSYVIMPIVINELIKHRSKEILDLGCGLGIYGAAVRQWCEMDCFKRTIRIIGVEGFEKYKNPNWQHYDEVIIIDIRNLRFKDLEGRFDTILMLDVIEHFDKREGWFLIDKLIELLKNNGILLISTPAVFCEQEAVYGNELERHKSLWTVEEFENNGFEILKDGKADSFGHMMIVAKYTNLN